MPPEAVARVPDPDGRTVVLDDRGLAHILLEHPEMRWHFAAILEAVSHPTRRAPDRVQDREWFLRRETGPSRWLLVIVDFEAAPARIVTAFGMRRLPIWITRR